MEDSIGDVRAHDDVLVSIRQLFDEIDATVEELEQATGIPVETHDDVLTSIRHMFDEIDPTVEELEHAPVTPTPGIPYEEEFFDAQQHMGQLNYRLAPASELRALFEGVTYEEVTEEMEFILNEEYENVQHLHHNQQDNRTATDNDAKGPPRSGSGDRWLNYMTGSGDRRLNYMTMVSTAVAVISLLYATGQLEGSLNDFLNLCVWIILDGIAMCRSLLDQARGE